jgi:hypothetical protein
MARVLYGNMVADARGHVGGVVYSRNTGGAYVRQKVSPVQPRTPAQLNQRSKLAEISKLWDKLTNGQRLAWKDASVGFRRRDVFGLAKQRTAQQMFMYCNLGLVSSGYPTILNPPSNLFVDAITSVGLVNTTSGAVSNVTVTAPGTLYTSPPAVGFSGGGGSGAAGTAVLVPTGVASVTVSAGGAGYGTPPAVSFSGGGGIGAAGTAVLTGGVVTSVTITAAGTGYTALPTVAFSGGGGVGATGTAVLTGVGVASVTVTAQGTGYTSAPAVALTGGGGSGATATATITLATTDLAVTYAPSPIPQAYEGVEVWMTQPFNVGKTFVRNLYRYIVTLSQIDTSPYDLTADWEAVFGDLPQQAGFKIGVRARMINGQNGARSEFASGVLLA